jgi:hypothetical protein
MGDTQLGDLMIILSFFLNNECMIKIEHLVELELSGGIEIRGENVAQYLIARQTSFTLRSPKWSLSDFTTKILLTFLISPTHAICLAKVKKVKLSV